MEHDKLVRQLFANNPWPDGLVEAAASVEDNPYMADELAWQVHVRVRKGQPVPPILKDWFVRYIIDGGYARTRRPHRQEYDRAAVAFLRQAHGMSRTKAIELVAKNTGRKKESVEANLSR